jgi:hypothetical protein
VNFLNPEALQTIHYKGRCPVTVLAKFGMAVQMPAPFSHVFGEGGDTVNDRHVWTLFKGGNTLP